MEAFLCLDLWGPKSHGRGGRASPPRANLVDRLDLVHFVAPISGATFGTSLGVLGAPSSTAVGIRSRVAGDRAGCVWNGLFHAQ